MLIAAIAVGAVAAGALAYLFLIDSGSGNRKQMKKMVKNALKEKAADLVSKKTIIPKKAVKALADHLIK